jgi:3-deoxy-7-phosphoheptulonate synthase
MALATNSAAAAAAAAAVSGGAASQPRRAPAFLPLKRRSISAIHAADPSKNNGPAVPAAAAASKASSSAVATPEKKPAAQGKWTVDSWKSKKALQLPEYPNQEELDSVLKTIETFPPVVFAGEARHLEERLAEAAMGRAFVLQGGDCAESFKEFHANNIRDTFRILLQMGAVLMFGGQVPVVKVPINPSNPLSISSLHHANLLDLTRSVPKNFAYAIGRWGGWLASSPSQGPSHSRRGTALSCRATGATT